MMERHAETRHFSDPQLSYFFFYLSDTSNKAGEDDVRGHHLDLLAKSALIES